MLEQIFYTLVLQ